MADRALQGLSNKLNAWALERELIFPTSKTVNMVFRKRKKRNEEPKRSDLRQQTELRRAY